MDDNKIITVSLKSNITFDFMHIEGMSEINRNIFTNKYIPTLNNSSKVLISFDNTNDAQGITTSALGYIFSVYKEVDKSDKLEFVTKLSEGDLSLVDYNVANQHTYTYYIFKEDNDYTSVASLTDPIETCWWNWSITGFTKGDDGNYYVDENNIWLFDLNIETADTPRTLSKTTYQNFTKYPKISTAKTNYASSSITCLIGDIINDKYVEPTTLLEEWNDFCSNNELKILKDRKGNKLLVDIISSSTKTADESVEQYNTLTFGWTEIGTTSDKTIIKNNG